MSARKSGHLLASASPFLLACAFGRARAPGTVIHARSKQSCTFIDCAAELGMQGTHPVWGMSCMRLPAFHTQFSS
eukprot:1161047-Pelagomonas_calceolata.AAC.54